MTVRMLKSKILKNHFFFRHFNRVFYIILLSCVLIKHWIRINYKIIIIIERNNPVFFFGLLSNESTLNY